MPDRAEIGILLRRNRPVLREVPGDAGLRREIEILGAAKRIVDDRIDDEIDGAEMPADDGTHFLGIAARIPVLRIVAELEIDAVEEGAVGRIRHHEQFADLETVERRTAIARNAVKRQIKPLLEPVRHAESKLGHAVQRVIGHEAAGKARAPEAAESVIVMYGEIDDARRRDPGVIDLDLVGLREAGTRREKRGAQAIGNRPHRVL